VLTPSARAARVALAITVTVALMLAAPDGKNLLAMLEGPTTEDPPDEARILEFDPVARTVTGRLWRYRFLQPGHSATALVPYAPGRSLVIERDNLHGPAAVCKQVFANGTGSVPVVDALMAALQFIQAIGIEHIERWDLMLANRLRDGLSQITRARLLSPTVRRLASAIATFAVSGVTGRALQDARWEQKIRVRAQGQTVDRPVRLSAHLYVSPADIDRVLEVVAALKA